MHYGGKDQPKAGYKIVDTTPYSHSANLASGAPGHQHTFLTYRRASEGQAYSALGITDICLIMPSKGESSPHTFCRVDRNLNAGMVSRRPGEKLFGQALSDGRSRESLAAHIIMGARRGCEAP